MTICTTPIRSTPVRRTLLALGLALVAGSAFAFPPLPPPPPSPSVVAHRIQSDVDHVIHPGDARRDREERHEDRREEREERHDRGHHYGWARHHHRVCMHMRHGECRRWSR